MVLLSMLVPLVGCGPPPAPVPASGATEDPGRGAAALTTLEESTLRDLAALDKRVALRTKIELTDDDLRRFTMAGLLAEDPSLAVVDGAIDPFSFEARGRGLAAVQQKLDGAPRSPLEEQELLGRFVNAERVRLEEERALPRSASALVRAVVLTWRAPTSLQEATDRDRWLARRLEELLQSANVVAPSPGGSAPLDVLRARELDDALDALEHLMETSALAKSTAVLVRLREALEAQGNRPAAAAHSDWPSVSRSLKAHLGLALSPESLDERFAALEVDLEKRAAVAIEASHTPSDVIEAQAAPLVFAESPCAVAIPSSRLRGLEPPPERSAACLVRRLAASANDDAARAVALVVAHDQVTAARWALEVARGGATIAQTTAKHRPRSRPGPDFTSRWERLAITQPVRAIGGGYAAVLVYGTGDPGSRARAWTELGDVPLDVVEREVR